MMLLCRLRLGGQEQHPMAYLKRGDLEVPPLTWKKSRSQRHLRRDYAFLASPFILAAALTLAR